MNKNRELGIIVYGATGYTGYESINLLLRHPQAEVTCLTAREDKCGPVSIIFPTLQDRLDIDFELYDLDQVQAKADVALPLPAATSKTLEPGLKSAASASSSPVICSLIPILE